MTGHGSGALTAFLAGSGAGWDLAFREMVDTLPVAVYATDAEGRLTYFNEAAEKLSGRALKLHSDEWIVRWKMFRPDGTPLPCDQCPMALALKGVTISGGVECVAERPDGIRICFTPYTQVLRDATARIVGSVNVLVESPGKKAARRKAGAPFHAIVEGASDCVFLVAQDGTLLFMNRQGLALTGAASAEAIAGANIDKFIAAEDRERFREFNSRICGGEKGSMEFHIVGRRGVRRSMEFLSAPMRHEGSTVQLAIARRISRRKRPAAPVHEEKLNATAIAPAPESNRPLPDLLAHNSLLVTLIDSVDEGVVAIDVAGNITYMNAQAELLTGWTLAEARGKPVETIYSLFQTNEEPVLECRIRTVAAGGDDGSRKRLILRARNGRRIPIVETVSAILNERRIEGSVAAFRDVSDILQFEEMERLRMLAAVAGGVAHDFNNLHAVMLGNVSLVMERLPKDSRERVFLNDVISAGNRATHLTSQLLTYAGQSRSQKKATNLSRLIRDFEPELRANVPDQISLTIDVREDLPSVYADPAQLRQVVLNLVQNACEAIGAHRGSIEISTGASGSDTVLLRVRDDGCGMDAGTRAKCFEPFFSTKFLGRGLGLAVVEGIVRTYRGAVDVHTETGKGSTFSVALPSHGNEDVHGPSRRPAVQQTVLVVDDVEDVRKFVGTALEKAGFKTVVSGDGASAIDIVRSRKAEIDAVLLDISMPGLSGVETGKRIRELTPSVPIFYMSGYAQDVAIGGVSTGASESFLQKPFTARQLITKLLGVIEPCQDGHW